MSSSIFFNNDVWFIYRVNAKIIVFLFICSEHMDELRRRGGSNLEVQQEADFPQWFKERVCILVNSFLKPHLINPKLTFNVNVDR